MTFCFIILFNQSGKVVPSLLPLYREVWAEGHHSASPSAHEKLRVSLSSIIRSETMNSCQLTGTIVFMTLTSDLTQNSISPYLSIQYHMTPRTLRNENDHPVSHVLWPFLKSLHWDKADAFYFQWCVRRLKCFRYAFIQSNLQQRHWVNKVISGKDCDGVGFGNLAIIIWPQQFPGREGCSEKELK